VITSLAIRAGAEFPSKADPDDRQFHLGLLVNSRKASARIVIRLENRDGLNSSLWHRKGPLDTDFDCASLAALWTKHKTG